MWNSTTLWYIFASSLLKWNFLMCLWAICVSFSVKFLFFCPFLIGLFIVSYWFIDLLYITWILTLLSVTGEWNMLFVQSGFPRVRWVATTGSGRATVQHHSLTEAVKYVHHILGNNRIETWKAKSLAKSRGKDETKMAAFSSPLLWTGQETWFSILFLLWEATLLSGPRRA